MKKTILFSCICVLCTGVFAQVKKPVATKPGGTAVAMKNAADSFSYAIGLSIANFYKSQGVKNINNQLVLKALADFKNNKPLMDEAQVNKCIVGFMQTARSEKSSGNKKAGEAFLAANKSKPGVITLPSGLQYMVITAGTGPKPAPTDQVRCHYAGSLVDGHEFESSYKNGQPVVFGVNGVIRGWTEALQLMNTGSKWKLFIPSELGYGDADNGPIPGGSTLIFEVELLEIVKQ
jgi:FKBP-type peptidyl-prolyl cis-trans isomerase FklB